MKKILPIFLFFSSLVGYSQISVPKYANEFLSIGVGARALGMGNVQTAITNDVTAGYWNPAGLVGQENIYNMALMHSELYAGIAKNDYVSFSMPVDDSSYFGISVIRTGVDNIPNTLNLMENGTINYDNITLFGVSDWGFLFSYAKKSRLIPGLRLGVNGKIIYRNVGPFGNAWGFGVDGGAQLKRKDWNFGLMVRDVTTTATIWTVNDELLQDAFVLTDNDIPTNSIELALPRITAGIARTWLIKEKFTVMPALDIDITTDGRRNTLIRTGVLSLAPQLGVEGGYKGFLFARMGIDTIQQLEDFDESKFWVVRPNFGLGLNLGSFTIDYALTRVSTGDQGLLSHIFSLKLNFDDKPVITK